jgi:hypothetical protein
MTTALALLQTLGLVLVVLLGRAALVLAAIAVLSVPIILFAYTVRAVQGAWHRHVGPRHAPHHA